MGVIDDEERIIAAAAAENDGWPFGDDATQDDPLTALRIAVTCSHPSWRYLVTFDRESPVRPTDAEALQLRSFLDEYKARWYNPTYLASLDRRPLDVDGGANGVIFHKFADGDWGYRRQSHTMGPLFWPGWPQFREREAKDGHVWPGPLSLVAVMDHMHDCVGEPNPKWVAWKAAHPDVFPTEG